MQKDLSQGVPVFDKQSSRKPLLVPKNCLNEYDLEDVEKGALHLAGRVAIPSFDKMFGRRTLDSTRRSRRTESRQRRVVGVRANLSYPKIKHTVAHKAVKAAVPSAPTVLTFFSYALLSPALASTRSPRLSESVTPAMKPPAWA